MERQLEKTVSCWKELSSFLRPQMEKPTSHTKKHETESMESLPMELSSVTLSERLSHMGEQSLLPEDLSSKTQLEVSAHACTCEHACTLYITICVCIVMPLFY